MRQALTLFAVAAVLAGCATYENPLTQRTERTMYTEQDEIDMGIAVDEKICREQKIIEPTPPAYVAMLRRLAAVSERPKLPYSLKLVDDKTVNAFAIPGGFIYLHTGLVAKLGNDDEIACVVGHELGHIVARDSVSRLQSAMLYSIPTSILFGSGRAEALRKAADAAFNLSLLKYSRQQELRADTLGVVYARKAGYDPQGMVRVLRKLQEEAKTTPPKLLYLLSSHPDIDERVTNVEATIELMKRGN